MIEGSWTELGDGGGDDPVRIAGLGVDYGLARVLDGVSLRVPAGEVFGLSGPNGAGKTTLFRVMSTLLRPTRGEVSLCGARMPEGFRGVRGAMAYMPDRVPMPSDLRAGEYLRFFAGAYGLAGRERELRIGECLESVGLSDREREICVRLSLGMRQRLALARALLHRPRLLILDEPANGLDPVSRVEMKNVLRRQAEGGATVILSSHVMAEIGEMCTSIGLLQGGRLLTAGPVRRVLAAFGEAATRVRVHTGRGREAVEELLCRVPGIEVETSGRRSESVIEVRLDERVTSKEELFTELGAARLGVTGMEVVETSVEEVVVRLSGGRRA
jgi:ABC-2 type transport system ATP-binding protein